MSRLSVDQVLALAPDSSAISAAQGVASPSKWASAGWNEAAVWGEALGSGKLPYQTAVDLRNLAYKCSCPSRKLPCKHALGLLIRMAKGEVSAASAPNWVEEWLEKREERSAKQAEKAAAPAAPPDPEAAAKRSEKRWKNILAGIDECETFLADVVGQGLLAAQSSRNWDQMAARMVDAQAPGIAARLRKIGASIGVGESWGLAATGDLGRLHLLLEAARRLETFDDNFQTDIRATVGIPIRREDLSAEAIVDIWDVLGQVVEVEDRLTACRSWLRARSTGKWALHLAFSAAGQPYDYRPLPGSALAAEAVYYPSAWPLRAHLSNPELAGFGPTKGAGFEPFLALAAEAWSAQPWIEQMPMLIDPARIGRSGRDWILIDETGAGLPIRGGEPWPLLAMTGNEPSAIFSEWNGTAVKLLSAYGTWGFVAL